MRGKERAMIDSGRMPFGGGAEVVGSGAVGAVARTLLVAWCVLLVVASVASAAASQLRGSEPSPGQEVALYQIRGEQLSAAGAVSTVELEYTASGRIVHTHTALVKLEPGQRATLVIPALDAVCDLAGVQPGCRLDVRIDGTLVESFDEAGLHAYDQRLRRQDLRAALDAVSGWRQVDPADAGHVREIKPMHAPVTKDLGCEVDCEMTYQECYWNCLGDPGCEGSCYDDYIDCLADCPDLDVDGDGIDNDVDSCPQTYNPNQADCDGDGTGDVCDSLNAVYQVVISEKTCMTDKDNHTVYFTFEHHVERLERDVSSCGAPDRWVRRVRMDNDCFNISDYDCCWGLRTSIAAVGDSWTYWCSSGVRNVDFCH
jgi:hypothetical protein